MAARLWGIRFGLPFFNNGDEVNNFVHVAGRVSLGELHPHHFVNPPSFAYVVALFFRVLYGHQLQHASEHVEGQLLLVARVLSAVLGSAGVWMLYRAGKEAFGRSIGMLAAALLSVSFLPAFYGHQAVNDGVTVLPVALALYGAFRVLRDGSNRGYLLAGLGIGLAASTKYTAGYVLLALMIAAAARRDVDGVRTVGVRLASGVAVALVTFVLLDPYAVFDFRHFFADLAEQARFTRGPLQLGETQRVGWVYYGWALSWGAGWAVMAAAGAGAVLLGLRDRWRMAILLVPPAAYFVFLAFQTRYYGRWLLPLFPELCLLAGYTVSRLLGALPMRVRAPVGVCTVALLSVQPLAHVLHTNAVMTRDSTLVSTRAWFARHVPDGTKIVLEPFNSLVWLQLGRAAYRTQSAVLSWRNFEYHLEPALVRQYVRDGYCLVVTGSTRAGRAFADPVRAHGAVAYYRELERRSTLIYRASPFAPDAPVGVGTGPVAFQFDWSYNYYPLQYRRTGPTISVYRLHGGRCG